VKRLRRPCEDIVVASARRIPSADFSVSAGVALQEQRSDACALANL